MKTDDHPGGFMMRNRWNVGFAALALFLLLGVAATPASAGIYAFGGYLTDSEDTFLGAGFQLPLGPLTASPNLEYFFVDEGKAYSINLDAHLNIIPLGVATLWAGGGMAIQTLDPDEGDSDTSTGVNLLLGVNLNAIPLKPFAHIKQVFIDGEDPFSVAVGIRF
jgi:hypothetical protein